MGNNILLNSVRFVVLLLAQVLVFDNILLFGYINPYVYLLFIILFPIKESKIGVIFFSFLLGLCVDFFNDSGGIHAAASVVAAYLRQYILKFSFGVSYEYNNIKVSNTPFDRRFTYIAQLVVAHHLALFLLEVFNLSQIIFVLKSTLFSGIFTLILCMLLMALFGKKSS